MPRVILHIGAHKTATSYMQRKLASNRDLLASRGVQYEPLDVFRRRFTRLLNTPDNAPGDYVADLAARAETMDLLLSDENLIGAPGDIVRKGRPYRDAGGRLAMTRDMLRNPPRLEVFLALRDYAGFMVSMYSEYIRHREFMTFGEYRALFEGAGFSWVDLVEDVVAALPGARVHLWDFGEFRAVERKVLAAMLGFDADVLKAPKGPVRESFSDTAIRAFEALAGVLDHADFKRIMALVSSQFPKGGRYPAFDPIEAEAKERLAAQYRADLATIGERWPDVTFIRKD